LARVGLTPERLTEAAADLADEIGFDEITLSALARQFGVQVASLYAHVAGSAELRTRVALLAMEEMADLAASALAGRAGKEALVAFADSQRDYALAHPGRFAAVSLRLDRPTERSTAAVRLAHQAQAVLRDYRLSGDDQSHAVRLMGSVVYGFVLLERGGSFDPGSPDPQVTWTRVLDSLDVLLRSLPAASDDVTSPQD
jgi:AcrR family transcriptional regulator